jgi:hypothetical protein
MPSIGSRSFIILRGGVEQFGETLEDITRPGQDGLALRKIGERGPVFELVSIVDVSSASGAQTLYETYKGDQGDIVNITDDRGEIHYNYAVLDVRLSSPGGIRLVKTLVGSTVNVSSGDDAYLLTCIWTLRAAGDPNA